MEAIQMDTLIVGNVQYLKALDIRNMLLDKHVVVCSEKCPTKKKKGHIKWYSTDITDKKFKKIFDAHSVGSIIYFSDYLNYQATSQNELEKIHLILEYCRKNKVEQFVYITSQDSCKVNDKTAGLMQKSAEEICRHYAENEFLSIKIVRSPYIIQPDNPNDFSHRNFEKASANEKIELPFAENNVPNFIDMRDLTTFIYRVFDNWHEDESISYYNLRPYKKQTYHDYKVRMMDYFKDVDIVFNENAREDELDLGNDLALEEYEWSAKYGLIRNFDNYVSLWESSRQNKKKIYDIILEKIRSHNPIANGVEIGIGAIIVEGLNQLYNVSAQFRLVDFRLLFVVLIATVYGSFFGFIAAIIETISLAVAFTKEGTSWELLLYEPSNWLPFLLLFVAAGVCGYVKQKSEEEIEFSKTEIKNLNDRNSFVTELYDEAMSYKNEYRQDLIESRDGFGRIFDVVKKLSDTVPERIYAESIPVMEDVLGTKSIAIFSIQDPEARFARLEVASQGIRNKVKKSIELSDYKNIMAEIDESEVWINKKVEPGYPVYMTGVKENGSYVMLIAIYQTSYVHMSAYYANLIRILRGLVENFLVQAWQYQKANRSEVYVDKTSILKVNYFAEQLQIQRDMVDRHLTHFRLIQIKRNDLTIEQIDSILGKNSRSNDIVGLGADGNVYILAAQVDHNTIPIVLDRLGRTGLECRVVNEIGE
ncbi:Nucleoside-diphosphate-sugar epimerase [Lachnospiraceae bacterium C7]|nr:Nucleoside-diphosphate-sugar epimerase [Lachnospiraceae bacterium C7]